jgi:hypothetical protein
MNNLDTIEEYSVYAKGLNYDQLMDAMQNVNKVKYPERYELLTNLLDTKFQNYEKPEETPEEKIYGHIKIIKALYVIALFAITLITGATLFSGTAPDAALYELVFHLLICLVIIYGLQGLKKWTRNFVLFWSYWKLFSAVVFYFLVPELVLSTKLLWLPSTIFYMYQIIIFSKSESKALFDDRGKVIISR